MTPLMAVAQALHGEDAAAVHAWVDLMIDPILKGKEVRVIGQWEELQQDPNLSAPEEAVVNRETRYFEEHRNHIHCQRWKRGGVPRGSGAVESWRLQLQRRFRTCGQFWKREGLARLLSLVVTFKNRDQCFLWN